MGEVNERLLPSRSNVLMRRSTVGVASLLAGLIGMWLGGCADGSVTFGSLPADLGSVATSAGSAAAPTSGQPTADGSSGGSSSDTPAVSTGGTAPAATGGAGASVHPPASGSGANGNG